MLMMMSRRDGGEKEAKFVRLENEEHATFKTL